METSYRFDPGSRHLLMDLYANWINTPATNRVLQVRVLLGPLKLRVSSENDKNSEVSSFLDASLFFVFLV